MSLIEKTTCGQCGKQYPSARRTCPYCGARAPRETGRAGGTASSARPGSAGNARAISNANWQLIFGLVILAAVVTAVIALLSMEINGRQQEAGVLPPSESPVASPDSSPTPTPTSTPTPSPTSSVTSITINYYGDERSEFTINMSVSKTVKMDAAVYPLDATAKPEWRSGDESIMTVDQTGLCTGVSPGQTTLYAEIGNVVAECRVVVA